MKKKEGGEKGYHTVTFRWRKSSVNLVILANLSWTIFSASYWIEFQAASVLGRIFTEATSGWLIGDPIWLNILTWTSFAPLTVSAISVAQIPARTL